MSDGYADVVRSVMHRAEAALDESELADLGAVVEHLEGRGPYDTKTVRVHLPERGQYAYLMLTRFDGRDHLLADEGWRGEYVRVGLVSRTHEREDAVTGDPFAFVRENDWLADTAAADLVKDLEMGRIEWGDLEDEMHLTPADVDALAGRDADEREVRA